MAMHSTLDKFNSPALQTPLKLEGLCRELSRTAQHQLEQVVSAMTRLAPRPGVLVNVQVHKLAIRMSGFEPVVFSAIDASTLLQVAQVYLTSTTAAAVSFVDFAERSFPFKILHIMTRQEKPFVSVRGQESHRDFSAIMSSKGVTHSIANHPGRDPIFHLTSRLTFGGISEGFIASASEGEVQRELAHFLFFHNNYRSVPWLGGKTPVQKLGSFEGYVRMETFDPYGSVASSQTRV
jgi:hypothetical protein